MRGTLIGKRYVDDIFRSQVETFLNGLPGAIFQQDNARPHTARVAQAFSDSFMDGPLPLFVPCRARRYYGSFADETSSSCSACEKLRDTVTGISALHLSLHDGRSPNPQNSFTELYRMSTQAIIKRKEEIVSKESTEEFIFPKKTARPVSPTSTQDPIVTSNNFSDLEQDVEHPVATTNQVTAEVVTPKIKLPYPIMLKIKKNFREQMKRINEKFPNIRNRTVNDEVKMFTNDHEEYRNLIHFLESDKDFEIYVIKRNIDKPTKAVIKGLPIASLQMRQFCLLTYPLNKKCASSLNKICL
ncbi:hypothetical protein TNCV_2051421 [Trichonephila clavipes]|nr:hypothetical protein TNCV_2051421 [Trichonephila clavipes]